MQFAEQVAHSTSSLKLFHVLILILALLHPWFANLLTELRIGRHRRIACNGFLVCQSLERNRNKYVGYVGVGGTGPVSLG